MSRSRVDAFVSCQHSALSHVVPLAVLGVTARPYLPGCHEACTGPSPSPTCLLFPGPQLDAQHPLLQHRPPQGTVLQHGVICPGVSGVSGATWDLGPGLQRCHCRVGGPWWPLCALVCGREPLSHVYRWHRWVPGCAWGLCSRQQLDFGKMKGQKPPVLSSKPAGADWQPGTLKLGSIGLLPSRRPVARPPVQEAPASSAARVRRRSPHDLAQAHSCAHAPLRNTDSAWGIRPTGTCGLLPAARRLRSVPTSHASARASPVTWVTRCTSCTTCLPSHPSRRLRRGPAHPPSSRWAECHVPRALPRAG